MVKKLQISIIFGKKTMQYQTVKKKRFHLQSMYLQKLINVDRNGVNISHRQVNMVQQNAQIISSRYGQFL